MFELIFPVSSRLSLSTEVPLVVEADLLFVIKCSEINRHCV